MRLKQFIGFFHKCVMDLKPHAARPRRNFPQAPCLIHDCIRTAMLTIVLMVAVLDIQNDAKS